jgi:hypothetical protein
MRTVVIFLTARLQGARPRRGKRDSIAGFTEERKAPHGASFW